MKHILYRRRTRLSHIPTELLENVLCRLSVKTIFQLRLVCKTWYEIFNNPQFISMHADWWAKNDNNNGYVISHHEYQISCLDKWFNFSKKLEFPIVGSFQLAGSCHGLLCLTIKNHENQHFPSTYLWNPSIRKAFKKLPEITNHDYQNLIRWSCCVSAFGFDSQSNDYKVFHTVWAKKLSSNKLEEYVMINWLYSLKTNSWKEIESNDIDRCTYPSMYNTRRTYLDGAFYWIPEKLEMTSSSIFWFDFSDETVKNAKLPIDYDKETVMSIVSHQNSVVAYICDEINVAPCRINAWVMKKLSSSNNQKSSTWTWEWNRKLSVEIPSEIARPLSIGLDGEVMLFKYSRAKNFKRFFALGIYDFNKHTIMELDNIPFRRVTLDGFQHTYTYSQSLLLLQHGCTREQPPLIP